VMLLDQRLRLTRVLYMHLNGTVSMQRAKRFFQIYAFEQVPNVTNSYLAYDYYYKLLGVLGQVLDCVNRRDRFSIKKPLRSSTRGASFHTKHASIANVVRIVLLDANSYLALWPREVGYVAVLFTFSNL
jgi:hypothetical protein